MRSNSLRRDRLQLHLQPRCRAYQESVGSQREPDIKGRPTCIDAQFVEGHSTRNGWMVALTLTRIVADRRVTGGMARMSERNTRAQGCDFLLRSGPALALEPQSCFVTRISLSS